MPILAYAGDDEAAFCVGPTGAAGRIYSDHDPRQAVW